MRTQLQDLGDTEFQIMHQSVLRLLTEYGVLFEDRGACDLLAKAGNRVDCDGRVHLESRFVESVLAQVPEEGFTLYGRDGTHPLRVAVDAIAFRPSTGTPTILDHSTGCRRDATADDMRTMVTLVDALDGFDMVHAVVSPRDVPGGIANVRGFIDSHRYSRKPSDVTVMTAEEVRTIARVAAAIRGGERELREKPLTAVDVAMISPLRCAREQTQALMECARLGLPVEVLTSPLMGVSAPVTVTGSASVALAEMVAALCLVYVLAPGLGAICTARIQPTDMHAASVNLGGPELGMGSVLVAACCARYHLPSNLYGLGTSAKAPGAQAQMEKMLSGLLLALGRPHMVTGGGMLDHGLLTSPEQMVIDDEAIRFIKRIRRPIAIDEEAIGLEALMAGMAAGGSLLAEPHTVRHLREELLQCGLGQWQDLSQWEDGGRPDLPERAHKRVQEILATHAVEPFEANLENDIQRILACGAAFLPA